VPTGSQKFRTETRRLLDIVVNSLYSQPDVFLRELVSNASDALDRVRFESLTDPEILSGDPDLAVTIISDPSAGTLTISDNGIGMTADELSRNLGTIAGSGTSRFMEGIEGGNAPELIGKFGVGFYSAFMVADRVEVLSRRAGTGQAGARWESDGRETFSIEEADRPGRGTDVILHLKDGMDEYLDRNRLESIVKAYSDYVPHPVSIGVKGEEGTRVANSGTPLWLTPEKEVAPGAYDDFYRHHSQDFESPFLRLSCHVEGAVEFHALLFVPSKRPMEAMMPDWRPGVDLYSRRIRIMESCPDLLPPWLRFVRGVVESPDLPLNISREMLQQSTVLRTMGKALVRKVMDRLSTASREDPEGYARFFEEFGDFLKEGLLVDSDYRQDISSLLLVWTTADLDRPVLLHDYVERIPSGAGVPYVTGSDRKAMAGSPHLEAVRRAGTEVLLLDGRLDELLVPSLSSAIDRKMIPLDREESDSDISEDDRHRRGEASTRLAGLLEYMKSVLGTRVRDVRISTRLDESPCVLVPDRNDPGEAWRGLMKAMRRDAVEMPGILEINPEHPLVSYMHGLYETARSDGRLERCVRLVHQMGAVLAGSAPTDPSSFAADISAAILADGEA